LIGGRPCWFLHVNAQDLNTPLPVVLHKDGAQVS